MSFRVYESGVHVVRGAQMDEVVAPEGQLRGAGDPAAFIADPSDREAWAAQLMRSIDSDSAAGLPTGAKACALGLDCGARSET